MPDFYTDKIILAPMAGVSDLPFRTICREYGADIVFSEMISARAMHYNDKKTSELLATSENEQPLVVQIFGNEPEYMSECAKKLESMGVKHLDINMGCPTPKIVNNGDGAALMKSMDKAQTVIRAVISAVKIPVSLKMRSGWDDEHITCCELAKIAENEGISAVTVHGRTRMQFYSGKANLDIIKKVKESVSIPVIGNGDIFSAADAVEMRNYTGCDSIMVARGTQGNPFIFEHIKNIFGGFDERKIPVEEIKNVLMKQITMLVEEKGEKIGICEARKHIAWYLKGLRNAAKIKEKVFRTTSFAEIEKLLSDVY